MNCKLCGYAQDRVCIMPDDPEKSRGKFWYVSIVFHNDLIPTRADVFQGQGVMHLSWSPGIVWGRGGGLIDINNFVIDLVKAQYW